jgi:hypothetical protein
MIYHNIVPESVEGIVFTGLVTLMAFIVFIFWNKRKALMNFQAWALLTAMINSMFLFNEYQTCFFSKAFDKTTIYSLYFIQFLTTLIIMFRLWKISEKYMPVETKEKRKSTPRRHIHMKLLAVWHTIKNGGNHHEDDKRIQKQLKKIADK